MMGDDNLSDPNPVDGTLSITLIRLASDEPAYSCVAYFCDRTNTTVSRLPLLQNDLNLNPLDEKKWIRRVGSIHESLKPEVHLSLFPSYLRTLKRVHSSLVVSSGFVAPKLISLYAQFGDHDSALSVSHELKETDSGVWNAIIKKHVDLGFFDLAVLHYKKMRNLGVAHDSFTFPLLNRAVTCLWCANMVHCVAIKVGFGLDVYFCNTLIHCYLRCGSLASGRKLFDEMCGGDLISWTSLIWGYVSEGIIDSAFGLFCRMRVQMEPNSVTLIIMLQGCSNSGSLFAGKGLHCLVIKGGFWIDLSVRNAVLKMYSNSGCVEESEFLFNEMADRDVISWNTIIALYSLKGVSENVAKKFNIMRGEVIPSIETLTLVISAFSKSRDLILGEGLHCYAIKTGYCDNILQSALLDLYANCGELVASFQLFREISYRNSITWNSMMSGLLQNGCFEEVLELFQEMQEAGVEPGAKTLGSLIAAYTHLGAFRSGKAVHGLIVKNLFHGSVEDKAPLETSVLNMYIRCGSLSCARNCFNRMITKDIITWTSMIDGLGRHASRVYGNREIGKYAAQKLLDIEPDNVGYYTIWSNIEAGLGKWVQVEEVRKFMDGKDLKKRPGWSHVESSGKLHGFVSGDRLI
ncbi:Pentatricopeptide repeat [Dillenia turbinata]|uniref:Pentatricopeptide repeat n=1 Tax=Dillenia turbinata TaxID=194707 RepID=A0AAN8ZPS8_9MAGN